jgi:hypothetical protein
MAMTNAISGMTIVGGMLQLGGGILPHNVVSSCYLFDEFLVSISLCIYQLTQKNVFCNAGWLSFFFSFFLASRSRRSRSFAISSQPFWWNNCHEEDA